MDTTVILQELPSAIELTKEDPRAHVAGAPIAKSEFVAALLRYGSAERYYFVCPSVRGVERMEEVLASYHGSERGRVIASDALPRVTTLKRAVLQTNSVYMFGPAHLRRALNTPTWPVVGMTHTLSGQICPPFALVSLAMLIEDLQPYDCLVCTTRAGREAFEKLRATVSAAVEERSGVAIPSNYRCAIIPLGVETERFRGGDRTQARKALGLPEDETTLLYFGRFAPHSKMDLFPLVLTFSRLVADRRAAGKSIPRLVLAGDDREARIAPRLEGFAADLSIREHVTVAADPAPGKKPLFYAAADVFLSPSDNVQETFGITVIEAMAAGLPIIASDWNGYRDAVEHGVTGFLVPTYWSAGLDHISKLAITRGDAPTHWMLGQSVTVDTGCLRHWMETLIDSPELRFRCGEHGRRKAEQHYDWSVIVGRYEALWEELTDAACAQAQPESFRYGCSSYDYIQTFGHYATRLLPPEVVVQRTPLGDDYAQGGRRLLPLDTAVELFEPRESRGIARLVGAAGGTLGELAAKAACELHMSPELALHHLARLLKYGIVELKPVTAD